MFIQRILLIKINRFILANVLTFSSGKGGELQNVPDVEKVTKIYNDIKRWGTVSYCFFLHSYYIYISRVSDFQLNYNPQ